MLDYAAPPLDFSFKELRSCLELETEEARDGGKRRMPPATDLKGTTQPNAELDASGEPLSPTLTNTDVASANAAAPADGSVSARNAPGRTVLASSGAATVAKSKSKTAMALYTPRNTATPRGSLRKVTVAVKLNNNSIDTVSDLPLALEYVMADPLLNLRWIDLSFNNLTKIDPVLLRFTNLKAIYLHKNQITSLPSVERLRKLKQLMSLTMNGNPIENSSIYRTYVVGAITSLRTLDHTSITDEEKKNASTWFQAHMRRAKIRKDRLEDEKLARLAD